MSAPSSPHKADWQAVRAPKLAYRKAISQDEADEVRAQARENAIRVSNVTQGDCARSSQSRPSTATDSAVAPAKKKNSFLSGLFTKEPTIMALAQVEADLKAKHGAATPQAVPHVSARKLPDHVPKVNSKWDGVPEVLKQREREEKQRKRASQRSSLMSHRNEHSHSRNDSQHNSTHGQRSRSRRESDAASGAVSWQKQFGASNRYYPSSVYTTSSEDSQEGRGRKVAPSVRSQSLRSPSGTSLPEITSFFPHHQQQPVPQRWQSVNSTTTSSTASSDRSRPDRSQREYNGTAIDVIPEHSSSRVTTPREMSPVTPSYMPDRAVSPTEPLLGTETAKTNAALRSKRTVSGQIDAFLAGEAQPVHLGDSQGQFARNPDLPLRSHPHLLIDRVQPDVANRPDSSRDRLGLRASMVVRSEAAPWEAQDSSIAIPSSTIAKRRLPKALSLFK